MKDICERLRCWADAMLRERAKTNHDAAPAARGDARECTAPVTTGGTQWLNYNANDYVRVKLTAHGRELLKKTLPSYTPPTEDADGWSRWQLHRLMNVFGEYMVMGLPLCFETAIRLEAVPPNHDAAPAARASVDSVAPQPTTRGDSDRTDKAAPRPSEGTGDTPATHATRGEGSEQREGTEPVAWGVVYPNDEVAVIAFKRKDAEERATASDRVVPLYRHPPVTKPMPQEKQAEVSDRSKPITGPDPDSRVWETHTPATHATQGECSKPREGKEPVAWAAIRENGQPLWLSYDRSGAEGMVNGMAEVIPLYRKPTLTDAERDDICVWLAECLRQASTATEGCNEELAERWQGRAKRAAAMIERLGGVE